MDTTTLGNGLALELGAVIVNDVKRNFMLKNLQTLVHASVPNLGDSFILALADSDSNDTVIGTALGATGQDPEDGNTYRDDQMKVRRIWSIATLELMGMAAGGSLQQMIQWKLPPKGIPVLKGRGLKVVCFNHDLVNNFSNGPSFKLYHKIMGGWF